MKSHPRDHANDFTHYPTFFVVADINAETFTNWIFAGKILFGHRLIDNDDARRIFGVTLVKYSTTQQRHLERGEVIATDHFEIAIQHLRRLRSRILFAPKTSLPSAHERSIRAHSNILPARQRAYFVEQRFREDVNLVAVVVFLPR